MAPKLVKKQKEVTHPYGFSIYPSVRKMQIELAGHFGLNATTLATSLIINKHDEVFGDDDEK